MNNHLPSRCHSILSALGLPKLDIKRAIMVFKFAISFHYGYILRQMTSSYKIYPIYQ